MLLKKNIIPAGVFLVSFGLYVSTLAPGWGAVNIFNTWDGLEYVLCSYLLGIDHPPGHPLYILLGRIFTLLPFGSPAFLMNLMSALFAALTVLMIYLIVKELLKLLMKTYGMIAGESIAVATALTFALSRVWWTHSVITEIHTLFLFMISLAFYFTLKWISAKKIQWLYLASALYGLSLSVSLFSAASFILPFMIFLVFVCVLDREARPNAGQWAAVFFFMISGLVFYAYYPLRASTAPFAHSMNYATPFDLGSFPWFVWFVSGKAWIGGGMFSIARIFGNLPNYFAHLISNFTFISLLPAFIPFLYLVFLFFSLFAPSKDTEKINIPPAARAVVFLFISFVIVLLPQLMLQDVSNPGTTTYIYVANFYLPSFFIFILLAGAGLGIVLDHFASRRFHLRALRAVGLSDTISEKGKRAWALLFIYLLMALPMTLFALNLGQCDLKGKNEGYHMAKDMLSMAERNSVIMSKLIYQLVHTYFSRVEKIFADKNITVVSPDIIAKEIELKRGTVSMRLRSKKLEGTIKNAVKEGKTVYISGDSIDQDKAPEYPLISDLYLGAVVPPYFLFSPPSTGFPVTELILYRVEGFHRAETISEAAEIESRGMANDGNFADKLELLGYSVKNDTQRFGRRKIDITLYWEVLDHTKEDLLGIFAVFNPMFQRIDPDRATAFYTLGGEKGSSEWEKGTLLKEDTTFYIPNLPFGEYYLALGVIREDGTTLPYYPASFRRTGRAFDFVLLLPFGIGFPAQSVPFHGR